MIVPSFDTLLLYAPYAGAALAALVLLSCVLAFALRSRRERRELRAALATLSQEIRRTRRAARGVRRRLSAAERQVAKLAAHFASLEPGGARSYDEAIRLVREGADAAKLMAACGLSRGEADLLVLMHGRRKAA